MDNEIIFENISEEDIPFISIIPVFEKTDKAEAATFFIDKRYFWNANRIKLTNTSEGNRIFEGLLDNAPLSNFKLYTYDEILLYSSLAVAKKVFSCTIYYTEDGNSYKVVSNRGISALAYYYNETLPGCGTTNDISLFGAFFTPLAIRYPISPIYITSSGISWYPVFSTVQRKVHAMTGIPLACNESIQDIAPETSYTASWADIETIDPGSHTRYIWTGSVWQITGDATAIFGNSITSVEDITLLGYQIHAGARHEKIVRFAGTSTTEGDFGQIVIANQLNKSTNYEFLRNYDPYPIVDDMTTTVVKSDQNQIQYSWIKIAPNKFKCRISFNIYCTSTIDKKPETTIAVSCPEYNFTFLTDSNGQLTYDDTAFTIKTRNLYRPSNIDIRYRLMVYMSPRGRLYNNYVNSKSKVIRPIS